MRRWVVACACVCAALGAIGCGSDKSSSGDAKTTASNKPVTLTFWDTSVPDPKVMDAINKAYMAANPNITIKLVHQPAEEMIPLVRSAIAKRSGPDIVASYVSPFAFDFEAGILPLNDYITDQQRKDIIGWDQATDKGNALIVPFDAGGGVFYYNKLLFKKAGLDPDAPIATWDDLLNACDKLNAAGIVPFGAGFKDGYEVELLMMQLLPQYQTDEELSKNISAPDYTSPAISKTIDLLRDLYKRKCFTPDSAAINMFPDAVNAFKAGNAAMFIGFLGGDVHWAAFRETKWGTKAKDGLGDFLAPLVPGGNWDEQKIQYSASSGHFITKWSPHPQEAYDYLMYLDSPDVQRKLFLEAGAMPVNTTADTSSDDPVAQQLLDDVKNKEPYLSVFNVARANVEQLMLKQAAQIMTGALSYDDLAPDLQAEQQKSAG